MNNQSNTRDTYWSIITSILPIGVTLITIITPFLYLLGLGFYQGRIGGFGVPSSFFPQTIEGYLVSAYSIITIITFKFVAKAFYSILWLIIIFVIIFVINKKFKLNIGTKIKSSIFRVKEYLLQKFPSLKEKLLAHEGKIDLFEKTYNWLLILLVLLGTPLLAYAYGIHASSETVKKFSVEGCKYDVVDSWSNCVKVIDKTSGKIAFEGLLVAQSDEYFALYNGEDSTVYHQNPNYSFTYKYVDKVNNGTNRTNTQNNKNKNTSIKE